MTTIDNTRVITGVARSSFMFCTKLEQRGKKITEDTPKTVKTAILIPKEDTATVKKLLKAIASASRKKFNNERYAKIGKDGCPLRDIDIEREDGDLPESMNDAPDDHYYFNATGYKLPGLIVDGEEIDKDDLETREEILVSGFYFKFSVTFKGYSNESDGVRALLNNIMFVKEGERLDGGVNAGNEDWGDEEEEETPRRGRNRDKDKPSRRRDRDDDYEDEEDETPRRRGRRNRR